MELKPLFKDIADAIRSIDGTGGKIPAEQFPSRIRSFPTTGGTTPAPSVPLDPVEVYKNTRPADWLPMPEPQDDEMYLLFHIPDGVSSLLAFTVTTSDEVPLGADVPLAMDVTDETPGLPPDLGDIEMPDLPEIEGTYTVEFGTVRNGVFVSYGIGGSPDIDLPPDIAVPPDIDVPTPGVDDTLIPIHSGYKFEAELFADDWGDLTSTGMKQVMVKVSGTDILTWEPSTHSKKTSPANFEGWNIVEIRCRLPKGTAVRCGKKTTTMSLYKLRYFTYNGLNEVTDMNNMFTSCYSLITIPALDTSKVTDMNNMFTSCCSLITIPALDTSKVTSMNSMFSSCRSLTAIPALDTSKVTSMSSMFYFCHSLTAIPELDTSKVTNMSNMFYSCYSLTAIPKLDTSKVTNMGTMFSSCYYLGKLKLNPSIRNWAGYAISLSDCSLGHKALVELFNSLPTITKARSLIINGNPGVSELTDEEKAIATDKNWTLTL